MSLQYSKKKMFEYAVGWSAWTVVASTLQTRAPTDQSGLRPRTCWLLLVEPLINTDEH